MEDPTTLRLPQERKWTAREREEGGCPQNKNGRKAAHKQISAARSARFAQKNEDDCQRRQKRNVEGGCPKMLKMDFADKTLAKGLNMKLSSSPVRAKTCVVNEKT